MLHIVATATLTAVPHGETPFERLPHQKAKGKALARRNSPQ
ncbi:hypothetical protein [Nostoc sp.]